jgi:PST family polysaccharide transporter
MGLARHVSWTALSQTARQLLQVALGIVLARLLTPEDFGLIGLTIVFTGFAGLFADLGLGAAIVQRKDISEQDLNFVFWLNLLTGIALTLVTILCAPLIARFYHNPRLVTITVLLGLGPLISSLGLVPGSLMQKEFRFKALAVADVVTLVVSGGIACWFAFRGFGAMSLVFQALATQGCSVALRWGMVKWRPGWSIGWKAGSRLLPFGSGLLGSSLVNYWFRNGDNLLVGRFCGAFQLGLYSRGYSLMMLPVTQVHSVLTPVLFPALSLMQHSKAELRRVFLFANQAIAVVAFPLMLGLAVVADDFVKVLWGDRWLGTVAIIRVFAIAGLGSAVGTTVGWIYMATGRSDRMLWWTLVASPVYLGCFALGLRWGALGVSIAYAVAQYLLLWYPSWRLPGSLIDLSFLKIMLNLRGPFVCALLMALGVLALRLALGSALPPAIRLPLSILTGACLYIGALQIVNVPAYSYIRGRVKATLTGSASLRP